jgi:hypothetical protein
VDGVASDRAGHNWWAEISSFRTGKDAHCKLCFVQGNPENPDVHAIDQSADECLDYYEIGSDTPNRLVSHAVVEVRVRKPPCHPCQATLFDTAECKGKSVVIEYGDNPKSSCKKYNKPDTWGFDQGEAKSVFLQDR